MDLLILGRTEILYDAAVRLARRHRIKAIVTAAAAPEYSRTADDFQALAAELGCPFLLAKGVGPKVLEFMRASGAELAVSLNWVSVVGQEVLGLFPRGVLNAHFGDLPSYRGNAVINWALLRHEPRVVLTVHQMAADDVDAGDLLVQRAVPLAPTTTIADIVETARGEVPGMFEEAVDGLAAGTLVPRPQATVDRPAFRCYPRLPVDSKIDWRAAAVDIDALVRASTHPYSGAYCFLRDGDELQKLFVWSSRVVAEATPDVGSPGHVLRNDPATGESWVMTGRGILALRRVQVDGRPEELEPGKAWRSIRVRLDLDLHDEVRRLAARLAALEGRRPS